MHVAEGMPVEKLDLRGDIRKLGLTGLAIADQVDDGGETAETLVLGLISPLPSSRPR